VSANAPAKSTASALHPMAVTGGALLQRKCKCGSSKSALGETCDECSSRALQRKVVIGASDDPFEIEADRIADRVLANNSDAPAPPVEINRMAAPASGNAQAPPSVERVLSAGGQPLDGTLKRDMEKRFGRDFSHVRIHVDSAADNSAHDVNALAFTAGSHIVFASGRFSPGTTTGRRLLAHELTHVVQQTGAHPLANRGARYASTSPATATVVQRQPDDTTNTDPAPVPEFMWGYLWAAREGAAVPLVDDVVLSINVRGEKRSQQFSNKYLAETCVTALDRSQSAMFRDKARQFLIDELQKQFDKHGTRDRIFYFSDLVLTSSFEWRDLFEPGSYEQELKYAARQSFHKLNEHREFTVIVRGDFGPDPDPTKQPDDEANEAEEKEKQEQADKERAKWAAEQYYTLKKLIEKARKDGDRRESLPDDVVLWDREDKTWHINVWLYFDKKGQDKKGRSVQLKAGERPEQLLERVRAAFEKTLETYREEQQKRREIAMPPWAIKLKRELETRLGKKKQRDVPDGMALVHHKIGTDTKGPSSKDPTNATPDTPGVLLHIWVERGEDRIQRNSASVPLLESTEIEPLDAYVRHLTVMLREYENAPDFKEITKWDLGSPDSAMPPFRARILPMDLRPDKITITGGRNKFGMELNYDEQYQSGSELDKGSADMYVASKLYNQTNFFIWRVFKVPKDIGPRAGEKQIPNKDDWGGRWKWLYEHYNPGAKVSETDFSATFTDTLQAAPSPGEEVTSNAPSFAEKLGAALVPVTALVEKDAAEATREPVSRVNMPGDTGEFLVFCETRHRPWGEFDLQRQPAYAYYPLRTETKDEIVRPLITATPSAIKAADAEIAAIEAALAGGKVDPANVPLVTAMRDSAKAHLEVLKLKEKSDLVDATAAEIREGEHRLAEVTKLRMILPELIKRAKEQNTSPSRQLQNEPALLALYWWLIREQKTPESYERQLTNEVVKLKQVNERATDYKDRFSTGEDTCAYTPEAVFVSEVDGNIYPLNLMIGQVPTHGNFGVAYAVADVTTEQTKDFYRGTSTDQGDEGHVEAIDDAFEEFGDKATYGEGWIGVRMPEGTSADCKERHTPGITFYRSEEGIIEKVWKALGFLALVIGVAALVATGVGAPAAAALLGAAAGLIGAAVSIHSIQERQRKGTLKADAELALDILGIIGVGELAAVGRLAKLRRAVGGFAAAERLHKFLAIYRVSNEIATAILIPIKCHQDIQRIRAMHLPPDVEAKLIDEAWTGAIQSGLMFIGSSVGTRAMGGHRDTGAPVVEQDHQAIRRQAEVMALESPDTYKSMEERGWIGTDGKWTALAPDVVREKNVPDPGAPALMKEAMEGVHKVNEGMIKIEEKTPGKRRARISDEHEIVEVVTPIGIACEVHSTKGPRIPCPDGMGIGKPEAPPPTPEAVPTARTDQPVPATARPELKPENLIKARLQLRQAIARKEMLTKRAEGLQPNINEQTVRKLDLMDRRDAYQSKKPGATAENNKIVADYEKKIADLDADLAKNEQVLKDTKLELPTLDARIKELEAVKQQFEGSKPWTTVKIGDQAAHTKAEQGFVGEIEMSLGAQSGGMNPMGKTIRAEEMLIPKDFEAALAKQKGQTGLDGLFGKPVGDETQFWFGESKTETIAKPEGAARTDPRGTVGELSLLKGGERQLSEVWSQARVDKFGLSATEAKAVKEAFGKTLKNGEPAVKFFYSLTDSKGTRYFEVTPVSATEVVIGKEIFF
jgi:hypothetical protein